jgi:gamma-carbonic anhydrase
VLSVSHHVAFYVVGCVLELQSKLAAGSVLAPDTLVPAGQLWAGNPAVYIRDLEDDEKVNLKKVSCQKVIKLEYSEKETNRPLIFRSSSQNAKAYSMLLRLHDDEFLPFGTTYQEAEKREL